MHHSNSDTQPARARSSGPGCAQRLVLLALFAIAITGMLVLGFSLGRNIDIQPAARALMSTALAFLTPSEKPDTRTSATAPPVPTDTPVPRATEPSPTMVPACYRHKQAWATGEMNVRARPSINAQKREPAQAGERFDVLESRQGDSYCWLRIDRGWMAVTALVSATKPQQTAPSSAGGGQQARANLNDLAAAQEGAPDHIINSAGRRIPLHDHEEFRRAVAAGFYYVRDVLGQPWWDYIEIIDDVRYAPGSCSRGYACMSNRHKLIRFGERHSFDPRSIASTLIHEACHMWQVRENRHHGRDYSIPYEDRPWEHECEAKEREAGF